MVRRSRQEPDLEQMYQQAFLNYDETMLSRSALEPEKMLVIAKDELIPALEPLVTWKRQMGIHTTVVPVSEIGSSESSAIYNFVKDYYQTNGITYLLLVGDEDAIQAEMRPSGGTLYTCDNCFGYMEGDDHFNEILVGRLHASNEEQLKIMVNRNLDYEKTPCWPMWPKTGARPAWLPLPMKVRVSATTIRPITNRATNGNPNTWPTAMKNIGSFTTARMAAYRLLPVMESADQPGNPVNTQLVDLMNTRGVGIYNYTGHGWEQGLSSGNFNVGAVATLRNNHRYPILIAGPAARAISPMANALAKPGSAPATLSPEKHGAVSPAFFPAISKAGCLRWKARMA